VRYVLDTHALVAALTSPRKLGEEARRVLRRMERGQDEGLVPAAVVVEIAILRELGRTQLGVPELKAVIEQTPAIRLLPLDFSQLETFSTLQSLRDPFDRLIVSATLATNARLVSKDGLLTDSALVHES